MSCSNPQSPLQDLRLLSSHGIEPKLISGISIGVYIQPCEREVHHHVAAPCSVVQQLTVQ